MAKKQGSSRKTAGKTATKKAAAKKGGARKTSRKSPARKRTSRHGRIDARETPTIPPTSPKK